LHELHRLHPHGHDLTDQTDDVFLVVGPVRIAEDLVGVLLAALDLILIDDPLERGAVAEPVVVDFGRGS